LISFQLNLQSFQLSLRVLLALLLKYINLLQCKIYLCLFKPNRNQQGGGVVPTLSHTHTYAHTHIWTCTHMFLPCVWESERATIKRLFTSRKADQTFLPPRSLEVFLLWKVKKICSPLFYTFSGENKISLSFLSELEIRELFWCFNVNCFASSYNNHVFAANVLYLRQSISCLTCA